ncbi:unnamed protein product, partial [Polarella glacialis]
PPVWSASLNASGLAPGLLYRLCVDLDDDGAEKPPGDSTFEIYVGVVVSVLSPSALRSSLDVQPLLVECLPEGCSKETSAFLSTGCEFAESEGLPYRTAEALFKATANATIWQLVIPDLTGLTLGEHYRLCTDLDGSPNSSGTLYPAGDTGHHVFIAPL